MQNPSQSITAPDKLPDTFTAPIDNHQVFEIQGPDTDRFLQGQVTCDIQQLTPGTSLPGAACNPKGRAYALFRLLRVSEDCVMMQLPAAIAEEVSNQLSKYLAFFKAEMSPAGDWSLTGLVGTDAAMAHVSAEALPSACNQVVETANGYLVATLPLADGTPRFELWEKGPISDGGARHMPGSAWRLTEIQSGLTTLSPETVGAYIPLNLNLHAIDGVSFTKGCYTGQEVIARMHHLGQLKKSLFRLEATFVDSTPVIGDPLVDADGGKLGSITDCIATEAGECHMLAVLSHKALEATVTLADQPAARVRIKPLGYRVPEQQGPSDEP
ncbi:hypothetical protein DES49_2475 [Halospina denitrificans]|uniref:Uncharacterized protein n=1 Tax=Halospina denitrificans TaxID=332522 RepID=A0A4V6Q2I8_9GAMM|nr:folate-binding protein YgfZ [Halospina denitrificans]TDT38498.1 hypothetical protein DES49_2475 [Halospina denitrificans]